MNDTVADGDISRYDLGGGCSRSYEGAGRVGSESERLPTSRGVVGAGEKGRVDNGTVDDLWRPGVSFSRHEK